MAKLELDKAKLRMEKAEIKVGKAEEKVAVKSSNRKLYEKAKPSEKLHEKVKPSAKLKLSKKGQVSADEAMTSKKLLKPKNKGHILRNLEEAPKNAVTGEVHNVISKYEDDNIGLQAVHKTEQAVEQVGRFSNYQMQSIRQKNQLRPFRQLETAEKKLHKAEKKLQKKTVNYRFEKHKLENKAEYTSSSPLSKWQQKRKIKKAYVKEFRLQKMGKGGTTASKTATKGATTMVQKLADVGKAVTHAVTKDPKMVLICLGLLLIACLIASLFTTGSMLSQSSSIAATSTSYTAEEDDILQVEADYKAKETALQSQIDNIETTQSGYDEYIYNTADIGHNPHHLAALLTALFHAYTPSEVAGMLDEIFNAQYTYSTVASTEIRTNPDTGEEYEWKILTIYLSNSPILGLAESFLTDEQYDHFLLLVQTQGNNPDIFGDMYFGGSYGASTDLSGVTFVEGSRVGNQALINIALAQEGQVGGYPYWSWYGFSSRVEWCACFVSWVFNQAGYSEPKFAGCHYFGVPWFTSRGQWASGGFTDLVAGDVIFFDWDGNGTADHVGFVIGTDGSYVYTVEGNSGDACRVKSYSINSPYIYGYGLMNYG